MMTGGPPGSDSVARPTRHFTDAQHATGRRGAYASTIATVGSHRQHVVRRLARGPAILACALAVAACGSGGKGTGAAAPSADAAAVLGGLRLDVEEPARIGADVEATLRTDGSTPADPVVALVAAGPVSLRLTGASGGAAGTLDVEAQLAAGPLAVPLAIRSDGHQAWLRYAGTWYGTDGSGAPDIAGVASRLSPVALAAALGPPARWLLEPRAVGDEDVQGIRTTRVDGRLDPVKVADAVAGALAAVATTPGVPGATLLRGIDAATVRAAVKRAGASLWVGVEDHELHRLVLDLDLDAAGTPAAARGISGGTLHLDATSAPAPTPTVDAPVDARPLSELAGQLGGLLSGGLPTATS